MVNDASKVVVESVLKVHSILGPGLLENAYEACLAQELLQRGLKVERQVSMPVIYEGTKIDIAYRLDMLVNDKLVVEVKAIDKILPIHTAQLLSYLKLGGFKLGLLLNFHEPHMRDGIKRMANGV
jgi:GxxExxY protein